jgi:hypothetical protein
MKKMHLITSLFIFVSGYWSVFASTITYSNSLLSGLTYSASGGASTAGYVAGSPAYAHLVTTPNSSVDIAMVTVNNGYLGASLGTLTSFLGSGSSFNLFSMTGAVDNNNIQQYAYWQLTLAGGIVINAFSDNTLGVNSIGSTGGFSTVNGANYFQPWSYAQTTLGYGGSNVDAVSVVIGGWPNTTPGDAKIISITVPGTASVSDGASTLFLLSLGLSGLAVLRARHNYRFAEE